MKDYNARQGIGKVRVPKELFKRFFPSILCHQDIYHYHIHKQQTRIFFRKNWTAKPINASHVTWDNTIGSYRMLDGVKK